jgi:hypothetical protein
MKFVSRFILAAIVAASFIAFIACTTAPGISGGSSSTTTSSVSSASSTSSSSSVSSTKTQGIMIDMTTTNDSYGTNVTAQWSLLATNVNMSASNYVISFSIYCFSNAYNAIKAGHLQWYLITAGYTPAMSTWLEGSVTAPNQWCAISQAIIPANIGYEGGNLTNISNWIFSGIRFQLGATNTSQQIQCVIANLVITNTGGTSPAFTNLIVENNTFYAAYYTTANSDDGTVTNE